MARNVVTLRKGQRLHVTFEAMKAFGEWSNTNEGPVVEALRAEAPRGKTQELAEGIYPVQKADQLRLEFHATVPYARYVIGGTQAHDIYPKDMQALFWEGAEHPWAHVFHPGTRPNNFPGRVYDQMGSELRRTLAEAMGKVVKIFAT